MLYKCIEIRSRADGRNLKYFKGDEETKIK